MTKEEQCILSAKNNSSDLVIKNLTIVNFLITKALVLQG